MNIIHRIRIFFGKRTLYKEALKVSRNKKPVNLNNASHIGIIYNLLSEEVYNRVTDFTKQLQDQGKKVFVIGLYNQKRAPLYYIPKLSYDLILKRDIDLFFRPSGDFVRRFIGEEFDLLIDLSHPDDFPLHYIATLSRARFKIGLKPDDRELPYDIMLEITKDLSFAELVNQMDYYSRSMEFTHTTDQKHPKE